VKSRDAVDKAQVSNQPAVPAAGTCFSSVPIDRRAVGYGRGKIGERAIVNPQRR
jgi:hypothetical protein